MTYNFDEIIERRILGYTLVYDKGYYEVLRAWCESRYGFFLHACEYNGVELVTSPLREEGGHFSMD